MLPKKKGMVIEMEENKQVVEVEYVPFNEMIEDGEVIIDDKNE